MPSLFSRSRTTSTPTPAKEHHMPSEFGVVSGSIKPTTTTGKKKKDKDKENKDAQRQLPTGLHGSYYPPGTPTGDGDVPPPLPDGSFLPTTVDPVVRQTILLPPNPLLVVPDSNKDTHYGFLSYKAHIVLSPASLRRAVEALNEELVQRGGLTTPFIFNSSHLEITGIGRGLSRVKRCIETFAETLRFENIPAADEGPRERALRDKAEFEWRDEIRFSGMHELGVVLRWTLARPIRISHRAGGEVRGLVDWDRYEEWRMREFNANFPPAHFPSLLSPPTSGLPQGAALAPNAYPPLDKDLQRSILTVMSLLTRITANSASSGHTPPSLAALFGPLFFGLGLHLDNFPNTYAVYLRSTHAMEHLILSFIRWQDSPAASMSGSNVDAGSGSARSLGVPTRLKEWIKNYPSGLDTFRPDREKAITQPRRGVRTIRVLSIRRNVRTYSPDLVKSASTWAHFRDPIVMPSSSKKGISLPNTTLQQEGGSLAKSKEWVKICPYTRSGPLATEKDRMLPKYAESFKRRMALGRNAEPATGIPGANPSSSSLSPGPSLNSSVSSTESTSSYFGGSTLSRTGSSKTASEEAAAEFESLSDLKWGNFESFGFGGGEETKKKLEFDLTESSRQSRVKRRETLNWNDFSTEGFSRGDGDLKSTLGFSAPVSTTISSWPQHREEMQRKLKKAQKSLPPFGWSTEPVIGSEDVIEEAFVDVFCDLIYNGGWADRERERGGEEGWLERECNWALVEYKAEPTPRVPVTPGVDPRTSSIVLLFEEFVPLEYRQQLAHHASNTKRPRLKSLFTSSESQNSKWKQAPTLNGKPYVLGATPSPAKAQTQMRREMEFEALLKEDKNGVKMMSLSDLTTGTQTTPIPAPHTPKKEKSSRFKIGGLGSPSDKEKADSLPKVASPAGMDRKSLVPAEYSTVDFETRVASDTEEDGPTEEQGKRGKKKGGDDEWIDILVGSQARRIGGQDALAPGARRHRPSVSDEDLDGVRSSYDNPDQASQDIAQALAGVRGGSFSDDDTVGRRRRGIVDDDEVDEIERVPRQYAYTDYASTRDSDMYTDDAGDFYEEQHYEEDEDLRRSREVRARAQAALTRARGGGGYFDQHPDRRPTSSINSESVDGVSVQEDDDEDQLYGRPSLEGGETTPIAPQAPSSSLSPPKSSNGYGLPSSPRPAAAHTSKTAALIEMYKEKERQQPSSAAAPSRIPVRGSSLDAPVSPAGPRGPRSPASPAQVVSPTPSVPEPSEPAVDLERPIVPAATPDRDTPSPARYVHGAPLHNVVEEEEEE